MRFTLLTFMRQTWTDIGGQKQTQCRANKDGGSSPCLLHFAYISTNKMVCTPGQQMLQYLTQFLTFWLSATLLLWSLGSPCENEECDRAPWTPLSFSASWDSQQIWSFTFQTSLEIRNAACPLPGVSEPFNQACKTETRDPRCYRKSLKLSK